MLRALHLFGLNLAASAPADRKKLLLSKQETADLLRVVVTQLHGSEVFIISSEDRLEFYLCPEKNDCTTQIDILIKDLLVSLDIQDSNTYFFHLSGEAAVLHLMRVAASLESRTLGDPQIAKQFSDALRVANHADSLGHTTRQLLVFAIRLANKARATAQERLEAFDLNFEVVKTITRHAPSASRVLILGAGERATSIARHIWSTGKYSIGFCCRTNSRTQTLAAECPSFAYPWAHIQEALDSAEVIIAANPSAAEILTGLYFTRQPRTPDKSSALILDVCLSRRIETIAEFKVVRIDPNVCRLHGAPERNLAAFPALDAIVATALKSWDEEGRHICPTDPIARALSEALLT